MVIQCCKAVRGRFTMASFKYLHFRLGGWASQADVWLLPWFETGVVINSLTSNEQQWIQWHSNILYVGWAICWRFRARVLTLRYQSLEICIERCLLSAYRLKSSENNFRELHVNLLCNTNVSQELFCSALSRKGRFWIAFNMGWYIPYPDILYLNTLKYI